ncbi:MAG: HAD-IA family hydrolase [Oscillospiraceae bacterium]|nr:HAD-IA family hydrolase [Oscillospiraceae bacterium]
MTKKVIFFDLDGTLTDSGEGIINSVVMTLERYGLPVPSAEVLREFVGPPLDQSFVKHGIPADQALEAVEVFRSRYNTVGVYENYPYPGIRELLEGLQKQGHRLFVATSKPETTAILVLKHFDLFRYFELVCGATADSSRVEKADVIAYLKTQTGIAEEILMVGDTAFDVIGAAEHGIKTIGVSWGYGKVSDMQKAGAVAIADSAEELLNLLNS